MSSKGDVDSLTPREREVLSLIAEGDSLAEIAQKLSRSLKTIESHRLSLGRKLKASNRVELAKIAYTSGLADLAFGKTPGIDAEQSTRDDHSDMRILEAINKALQNVSGEDYINALCEACCKALDVNVCGVCISAPDAGMEQRFAIGIYRGKQMQPAFYYSAVGSPIAEAQDRELILVTDGLTKAYPDFPLYREYGLCSYLGLRIDGDYGADAGVLAIADVKPIKSPKQIERILRFFLDRTSAELSLMHKSDQIKALRTQLKDSKSSTHRLKQAN